MALKSNEQIVERDALFRMYDAVQADATIGNKQSIDRDIEEAVKSARR
jgi:hypothetical protein